jgi:hypothetical protein
MATKPNRLVAEEMLRFAGLIARIAWRVSVAA